jgi:8-oxo-dGTP diphosphatase
MKHVFSAGGVVYKQIGNETSILVCQHSQHHGWVFPKGLIGDTNENETKEETALREVTEETGITATILQPLTPASFWYVWEGEKYKKTVDYFLMQYVSGDTDQHDFEMEAVEWIPIDEVTNRLTYKGDKDVWAEAKELLK